MATETLSLATDFGGSFDGDSFASELSADPTLAPRSPALWCRQGDAVKITVDQALDGTERTALEALATAHAGTSTPPPTRIRTGDGKIVEATSFSGGTVTWTDVT